MAERDEFYTGYLPEAPQGIARHVRRTVIMVLLVAAVSAALLATSQRPFDVAFFEFGAPRSFTGTVVLDPYPMLRVQRPGSDGEGHPTSGVAQASHYYVVAFGKHSARPALAAYDGQQVRLEGTLIYRDDQTMLELVDGSVEPIANAASSTAPAEAEASWGRLTLRGEIVDSKCYLGVMKPGHHKPHRACASLCIRGGIPPLFALYDDAGSSEDAPPTDHLLLVGPERQALGDAVLDYVAEPLEITGQVVRQDDVWMLEADPRTFRRLKAE